MSVAALLTSMSSSELTEWACYLKIKHAEQEKASSMSRRR